jgi:hypothetical protein
MRKGAEEVHITIQSAKSGASRFQLYLFFMLLLLLAGCATAQPQSRSFFQVDRELETHGRKTWFDHLFDADPGGASFKIADDYQERPPREIAVLPFVDKGEGSFLINKIPGKTRDRKELNEWSWTHANRVRRAFAGELGTREFTILPLLMVDAVLANRGIIDGDKLNAVPPEELGRWLDADTVVYGELLSYEAYYGFLVAAWEISARVRMVSTIDGHEIFSCTDHRFSSAFNPAIDPLDMVINSVASLIKLRDIELVRTEYEVGREIVIRLPTAQRNISGFQTAAKEKTLNLEVSSNRGSTNIKAFSPWNWEIGPGQKESSHGSQSSYRFNDQDSSQDHGQDEGREGR